MDFSLTQCQTVLSNNEKNSLMRQYHLSNRKKRNKTFPIEVFKLLLEMGIMIHDGYGYMKEYEVERYLRNAKLLEIGKGMSQGQNFETYLVAITYNCRICVNHSKSWRLGLFVFRIMQYNN